MASTAGRWELAVLVALILCACSESTGARSNARPVAVVHGKVTAGPTCPVERVGHPCPARSVTATILATAGTRVVASTRSSGGRYLLDLPIGTYTISAIPATAFPRCNPRQLTIVSAREIEINLQCDTGIR
jgi:hypothetical protein